MTTIRTQPAIRATGLRKSFGKLVVLDGVDLEVAAGTVFALLGPNGAGKTTTVQILSTLIGADGGEVLVAGHDVANDPEAGRAAADDEDVTFERVSYWSSPSTQSNDLVTAFFQSW